MAEEKSCCCCENHEKKGKCGKKHLWMKVVAAIIVIVLLVLIFCIFFIGGVIKAGIEKIGPKVTQSSVTVDSVKFYPLRGKVSINGLVVGNPEGFNTESALKLGKVYVSLKPTTLFSGERILINEILVENPEITYEIDPTHAKSNIGRIQENVNAFLPKKEPSEPKAEKPEEEGRPVEITHIFITGGKINLSATVAKGKSLPIELPTVELKDVGKGDKVTMAEAAAKMLDELCGSALTSAKDSIGKWNQLWDKSKAAVKAGGQKIGDAFKALGDKFKKDKNEPEAAEPAAEPAAQPAAESGK